MKKKEFKVAEDATLLEFLQRNMPDSSRNNVKELLAHSVYVDGRRSTRFDHRLYPGMTVTVERNSGKERLRPSDLDIVYEDRHLFVINKHYGLLSYSKHVGDKTVITELNTYLEASGQHCHAHIVHRLDRDTSGLLIVSKSKDVSRKFEEDWKGSVYDRRYVAVVWGSIVPSKGVIRSWLTDGKYCVLSSVTDNGGKLAVTHYEEKGRSKCYSLVELKLDTGRRNQIRVHLREMGHPVVHDPMYGYKEDRAPINRLALHAFRLCFIHPITGKRLAFETPLPSEFRQLMDISGDKEVIESDGESVRNNL